MTEASPRTEHTREALARYLISNGVLRSGYVADAFLNIDRADFVRDEYRHDAYEDAPLPIGEGQTISQPTVVAFMLELLQPRPGDHVLDIGAGSGYTTALLAHIVGREGRVEATECIESLVRFGRDNLDKYDLPWAQIREAYDEPGLPGESFDRILVSAAADELPIGLIHQLRVDGVLVIPIKGSVWRIKKVSHSHILREEHPGFAFVPLRL